MASNSPTKESLGVGALVVAACAVPVNARLVGTAAPRTNMRKQVEGARVMGTRIGDTLAVRGHVISEMVLRIA